MYAIPDLDPGEKVLCEGRRSSSWMYVFGAVLALTPPFVLGIALLIATYVVDGKSGAVVTNRRLVQHRQWPWPGKFSHAEIELKHITSAGKSGIGGFDLEQNFLNRILGLGDIEIHHDMGGNRSIIWLNGIKNPKKFIKAIRTAMEDAGGSETAGVADEARG